MKKTYTTVLLAVALALSMFLGPSLFSSAQVGPISGAIFTTDETGLLVDGNIYANALDVFLSGGPGPNAPPSAAGLPDGEYYFQVTDPPGKKLLSTDGIEERRFRVEGGVITQYLGTTHAWNDISSEIPNAIVIQLWPFGKTPNKGGVYKAWATPVDEYTYPTDSHSFFGFVPRYSKTDNYKVRKIRPITKLIVDKFHDVDNSGFYDNDDYLIVGWSIDVTDPLGVTNTYHTHVELDVTGLPGDYVVTEHIRDGWVQTAVAIDSSYIMPPVDTVTVTISNGDTYRVLYGNRKIPVRPTRIRLRVSPALPYHVSPGGTEYFDWEITFLTTPVLVTLEVVRAIDGFLVYSNSWDVTTATSPIVDSDSWTVPLDAMLGYYTVIVKYYSAEIGPTIPEAAASRVFEVA